ncbi:uncharacterized protein B0H18DRAFT_1019070 [Fomitopsis serialis]|uniref:uncharacterized protein n=1 Tax=Fomitopsis serialis TaxID=139415 RepID=UPI0020079E32|nr:uncharacterized protein B0H18DRAFT_1019070 [Neoantrodia serialis]KAH9922089.1 hypothetical protein B0H18DRAFT_1019070 [Neoantrodia serialis]
MQREIYMNIPAQNPQTVPSFEERRVQDYLHAYRTTGKPPASCPAQPTDRAQRASLGLPPLIEPHSEIVRGSTDILLDTDSPSPSIVVNGGAPGAIPDTHTFRPVPVAGEARGAFFQCIVSQPEFVAWSFEELRVSAYAKGRKLAPEVVQRPALQPAPVMASSTSNGFAPENYQNITCKPDYIQHSVEELRLAFYRAGRQLRSAEIIQRNAALRIAKP